MAEKCHCSVIVTELYYDTTYIVSQCMSYYAPRCQDKKIHKHVNKNVCIKAFLKMLQLTP
jgi:hypothetical protein